MRARQAEFSLLEFCTTTFRQGYSVLETHRFLLPCSLAVTDGVMRRDFYSLGVRIYFASQPVLCCTASSRQPES